MIRAALLAGATLAALHAASAHAAFPSPVDWRDHVVYQIITDRFFNGDPANDALEGNFAPADGFKIHGGDFAGIEAKLDYLLTLGVSAIWISPVPLNAFAEYHGFAARDHRTIAPHFGGLAALQSLVQAAHARGIYVILDMVCNHMGDLIGSAPPYPAFRNPSPYVLAWNNANRRHAPPFDNLSWYHNNGHIQSFVDPEQTLGELFGLDDLNTSRADVRDELVDVFTWLIQASDCDGFRVDTVKHAELEFWQDWVPRVRAFAAGIGKANFLFFGEVFDGSDFKNGIYTGTQAGGPFTYNSMLYFPMYFTTNDVFAFGAATNAISSRYAQQFFYDAAVRDFLVRFLDNHDVPRFLAQTGGNAGRLRAALVFHLTAQGIPALYYGTEQGFDGGSDPADREDMFDGAWEFGPSLGDDFDEAAPLFAHTQQLVQLRSAYAPLRRGVQIERLAVNAPGIYAWSRILGAEEVLVVVNTSPDPKTANNLATTWAPGTVLRNVLDPDVLDPGANYTVEPLGSVDVALGGFASAVILPQSAVLTLAPVVAASFPAHDAALPWRDGPIEITFSKPMHESSVEVRLQVSPATPHFVRWSGNRLRIHPFSSWVAGQEYTLSIEAGAHDTESPPKMLPARYELRFRVAALSPAISVQAGFEAETFAFSGLGTPEGIEFAGAGFGAFCYVGDEGLDRVLALDSTGAAAVFGPSGTLTKPEGLARDTNGQYGGGILVADQNGVFKLSAAGVLASFLPSSSETITGWIGIDPGSAFGGQLHLGSNSSNWIRRYTAAATPSTLASGINGFEAAAFGPGGTWGTDLYVADPDLTTFFAGIDGTGTVRRVQPNGTVTTFAAAGTLTAGLAALAFDPTGAFGGDLFGADIARERIVRITPSGQASELASGFGNLFSSDCLAFSPAGDLYVVDTGSGQGFTDTSGGTAVARIVRIRPAQASDTPPISALRTRFLGSHPNPFNPRTTLRFTLQHAGSMRIDIHDMLGKHVRRLLEGWGAGGAHEVVWDGRDDAGRAAASGVYVARLSTVAGTDGTRLVLVR